jgi:hypothetical protein
MKQLLSLSLLVSSLTLGGTLMAAPFSTSVVNEGPSVQVLPDGTKTVKDVEGATIQIQPDGTKMVTSPDGAIIQLMPDGSKMIKNTNGTTIQVAPDGSKIIKTPGVE